MAGFGRNPFGRGPFGKSDLGGDLVIELFPEEWLGEGLPSSVDKLDNDQDQLLKILYTFRNAVNNRRNEIDELVSLTDYETMRLDLLRMMGRSFGLNIDKNEPEFIQRSFVGNASQWLQIKSSKQGYSVRGRASGFDVFVENFWRIDPMYSPFIPLRNQFLLKPDSADPNAVKWLHTDSPPGTHAGTPSEEDETYAKSAWLRVAFEVAEPRRPNVDYNPLLDLVILKITDVVGLHHELTPLQFRMFMNVNISMSVEFLIAEDFDQIQTNEFYRFDITPADVVPLDQLIVEILRDQERANIYQYVNIFTGATPYSTERTDFNIPEVLSAGMTADDENLFNVNINLMAQILKIISEVDAQASLTMSASGVIHEFFTTSTTLSITSGVEVSSQINPEAQVFFTYDFIEGDSQLLDGPISVTMSIEII